VKCYWFLKDFLFSFSIYIYIFTLDRELTIVGVRWNGKYRSGPFDSLDNASKVKRT
jgi:hypothetical protein